MKSFIALMFLFPTMVVLAASPSEVKLLKVVQELNQQPPLEKAELINKLVIKRSLRDQQLFKKVFTALPPLTADGKSITFTLEGQKVTVSDMNWKTGAFNLNGVNLNEKDSFEDMAEKLAQANRTSGLFSFLLPEAHAQILRGVLVAATKWEKIAVYGTATAGLAALVGWPYLSTSEETEIEITEVTSECEILKSEMKTVGNKTGEKSQANHSKVSGLVQKLKNIKDRDSEMQKEGRILKSQMSKAEDCVEEAREMITTEIKNAEKTTNNESIRAPKILPSAPRNEKQSNARKE